MLSDECWGGGRSCVLGVLCPVSNVLNRAPDFGFCEVSAFVEQIRSCVLKSWVLRRSGERWVVGGCYAIDRA